MERDTFFMACRETVASIAARRGPLEPEDALVLETFTEDDNLFALGLVDSLSAVDLIDFIETSLEIEIPMDDYEPSAFYTMRSIYDTFGVPEAAHRVA